MGDILLDLLEQGHPLGDGQVDSAVERIKHSLVEVAIVEADHVVEDVPHLVPPGEDLVVGRDREPLELGDGLALVSEPSNIEVAEHDRRGRAVGRADVDCHDGALYLFGVLQVDRHRDAQAHDRGAVDVGAEAEDSIVGEDGARLHVGVAYIFNDEEGEELVDHGHPVVKVEGIGCVETGEVVVNADVCRTDQVRLVDDVRRGLARVEGLVLAPGVERALAARHHSPLSVSSEHKIHWLAGCASDPHRHGVDRSAHGCYLGNLEGNGVDWGELGDDFVNVDELGLCEERLGELVLS